MRNYLSCRRLKSVSKGLLGVGLCWALMACGTTASSDKAKSPADLAVKEASGKRVAVKESAISIFSEATELAKTYPVAAIEKYKQAIKEEKNFAEAYYNIGVLELRHGNKDKAREAFKKAIEINPELQGAQTNYAKMLIDDGEYDEAEKVLLRVVDDKDGIDPYNVEANLNLGMIYRKRGEDILERDSGGVEPKFSMGETEDQGEIKNKEAYEMFAKAIVYVRRALAGDSSNIYCYENLSAVYYLMNSLEVARLVSTQALIKFSDYNDELQKDLEAGRIDKEEFEQRSYKSKDLAAIYNTSGLIYLAEGEVSLANAEFKKALDADPDSIPAMLNIAGIAVNVQDYPLAYELYDRILKLQPDNLEAYLSKGVAARGLNQLEEAEQIYRDIIAKDKTYPQARFNLNVLYQEYYLKIDESRKMWEEFIALPEAQKAIPGRVEEAKLRIRQIDELKEAMKKAEEEEAKIKAAIAEMERKAAEVEAAAEAEEEQE